MIWIDTAEDSKAMFAERGHSLTIVSLDVWRTWGRERRAQRDHAIASVSFRGDGERFWIMVSRDNLETDPATWTVWDIRHRHPLPVYRGFPSLKMAQAAASIFAASRAARMLAGAKNIALATVAASVNLWRTETTKPVLIDEAKAKRVNVPTE